MIPFFADCYLGAADEFEMQIELFITSRTEGAKTGIEDSFFGLFLRPRCFASSLGTLALLVPALEIFFPTALGGIAL